MEKINLNHKILCNQRKNLELTGVEKVESTSETQVILKTMGTILVVTGKNMHLNKLDVKEGIVEIEGQIDGLKYQTEKKNFLKRIFK